MCLFRALLRTTILISAVFSLHSSLPSSLSPLLPSLSPSLFPSSLHPPLLRSSIHSFLSLFPFLSQVLLTPNTDWGGEGSLGCGIGYGYLHRIPAKKQLQTPSQDPEVGVPFASRLAPPPTSESVPGEGYADVRSKPHTVKSSLKDTVNGHD